MTTTKTPKSASTALAQNAAHNGSLVMTSAEKEAITYFNQLNEQLETPFAQPRAIAERGIPFTILRIGERDSEPMYVKPSSNKTGELERHMFLLVEFEDGFTYKDNARQEHTFSTGDRAIVSLKLNPIRSEISGNIARLLSAHGAIPNMTCREVPLSNKSKAAGNSPAITICHTSQWQAL